MIRRLLLTAIFMSVSVLTSCSQSESPVTPASAPPGNDAPQTAEEAAADEMSQVMGADEAGKMSGEELDQAIKEKKAEQKKGEAEKK